MTDAQVTTLIQGSLETLMWIILPMLATAVIIGVVVSLIQTLTSIQDQTFSFAPRLVAVFVIFLVTFPWMLRILVTFTDHIFGDFTPFIK